MIRTGVWFFVVMLYSSNAIIHHLNETEYQRMPPLWSLDDYKSCLVEEGSSYCMLQLTLYAEPGNELMKMITDYSDHTIKHYNYSVIARGICVKKTCLSYIKNLEITKDQRLFLEVCLNDSMRREYGLSAKVSTLYYCNQHNEPVNIDAWDWIVLVVILGLVSVNIVGSVYDYRLRSQIDKKVKKGNVLLLNFSFMKNWERLLDTENVNPNMKDWQFLHGARVISNLSTILVHSMIIFVIGFSRNTHDIEKTFDLPMYYLFYNGPIFVEVFFFISGTLKSYDLHFDEEKRSLSIWDMPKTIFLRVSRFLPALAMTLALVTSCLRHAGSGPLWKLYVTDSLVADCRSCWWHHLLFVNNYVQGGKYCLISTWHLAAEMQVFLVGVSAFLLSRRVLLPIVLLLSIFAPAFHTIFQDLNAVFFSPEFLRTYESRTFWLLNALGHNNLSCFIIGMYTGSSIYEWQKKRKHLVTSWWWTLLQYVSVALIPLLLYSGCIFYVDGERAGVLSRATYNSAIRVLLGLAFALVVFAFINKSTSFLKRLFEWRWWMVASRLTYCVFLLHMILIHTMMGSRTHLSYYSFFNVVCATAVVVVASYLLSVPLHLLVEAPFTRICKQLVQSFSAREKDKLK